MATLLDSIHYVQSTVGAIPGISSAPDAPPESINQFPFALTYSSRGTLERMSDWTKGLHTIVCEIHFSRQNLPRAIEQAMPYLELFINAIWSDPTLGATVSTIKDAIRYEFGFLPWGGASDVHIGFRFEIDVKIENGIS